MKRLVLALLVGCSTLAAAQDTTETRPIGWLPNHILATTYCRRQGDSTRVMSVVDMGVLDDSVQFEAVRIHEATHRLQYLAQPGLCWRTTWADAVVMEVQAYCASAHVFIRHGMTPEGAYIKFLGIMLSQFDGHIRPEVVTSSWNGACPELLRPPR